MGPLAFKFEEPGDGGAQTRHPNVVGVGQGEGRAVLDHEVAQDTAGGGRH